VAQHVRKIHSLKKNISLRGERVVGETERDATECDYEK
jgi:hypothetical protein